MKYMTPSSPQGKAYLTRRCNLCEFISWIEYEGKEYFLKDKDLETREGKILLKEVGRNDICGHGAIRNYYAGGKQNIGQNITRWGKEKECTDFSTPKNFPSSIVKCLKSGGMSKIGLPLDLLNDLGKAEYKKITNPALAEYNKIKDQALAEYKKIADPALAEYNKIKDPALAEYNKITDQAWAEYNKIKDQAFWKIFAQNKYRNPLWN